MIKPTIGRIVWYHPYVDSKMASLEGQPHAAIVTGVHDDGLINLAVFDSNGTPYAQKYVKLIQERDHIPDSRYAEWMPYQIGQAKKHEAKVIP